MALTKVTGQVIKNTTDVTVGVLTVTNTLAVGGTVSIGGTLTYEDVTNVDAVGIITARSNILVGSGITLSPDGDVFATGISTFSEGFAGDILIDDKIVHRGDTNTVIRFPSADTIRFDTAGDERFRITSGGSGLFGGLTAQHAQDTSKLAVQAGISSNIGIIQVHAGGGESVGDLSGITFSHGADNETARAKCAIASRATGAYGRGDLCFYVDGANDDLQVSAADEKLRITYTGDVVIGHTDANAKLQVNSGTSGVVGDSTNPAFQIGGTSNYRLGMFTTSEQAIIANKNGDDGIAFHTKTGMYGSFGEAVRITSAGFVGIGSDVPQDKLTIMSANDNALLVKSTSSTQYHSARIHLQAGGTATDNVTALVHGNNNAGGSESYFAIESKNSGETYIKTLALYSHASDYWDLNSGASGSITARLNASNQVIIGGAGADRTFNSHASRIQLSGNDYSQSTFSITNNANDNTGAYIFLCKQRSGSHGGSTAPVNGDLIGQIRFNSGDGTDMETVAGQIQLSADDNHGSNSVPSRMQFYTTLNTGPIERFRITSGGEAIFGSSISPGTTEQILIETGGTIRRRYSSTSGFGVHFTNDSLMPTRYDGVYYNGTGNLGASNYRWNTIFATNATINQSDRNLKNTIQNSDLGLDFISKLTPVSYKMNDGTSGRTHYGLISQDVETVLTDIGKTGTDFAGFCKDRNYKLENDAEGNDVKTELDGYNYSLRYTEFIAPLIKAVQELSAENTALKARLDAAGL